MRMTALQAINTGAIKLTGDMDKDIARMEAWDKSEETIAESDALERMPMLAQPFFNVGNATHMQVVEVQDSDVEPISAEIPVCPESTNEGEIMHGDIMQVEERFVTAPVLDQLALDAEAAESQVAAGPVIVDDVVMGKSGVVGTHKEKHNRLILNGVCSNCAHCAMKLTDAVSIQRGLGPVCSRKGYEDVEPHEPDEMQAFIALADYPALCEHLAAEWKPKGIRGLMNGLVRICSLNRKSPVHAACCKAIELLGYKQLASTLRESLAVVSIKRSEAHPGEIEVWVKRTEYNQEYGRQIREIFGAHWVSNPGSRNGRRGKLLIPIEKAGDSNFKIFTFIKDREGHKRISWAPNGVERMSNKALVWHLLCRHFEGLIAKTDQGGVYIKPVQTKP